MEKEIKYGEEQSLYYSMWRRGESNRTGEVVVTLERDDLRMV